MADEQMPQPYTTASQTIASLSSREVLSGLGIQLFYLTRSKDSSGFNYHLIEEASPCEGDDDEKFLTGSVEEFDTSPLNLPRTVSGVATVSCDIWRVGADATLTFQLKKYNPTTSIETNISSVITTESGIVNVQTLFMEIPLTETVIASGELIRLEVTANTLGIGIDPAGVGEPPNILVVTIPAKLFLPFKLLD